MLSQKEDSITADNYNTLEVPLKCDFRFTMSDGTKVWINAGSTLKYPAKFAADSRTVYASGEIYLEVAKDAERPFYVVVDGITVKVLGTSFNIRGPYVWKASASIRFSRHSSFGSQNFEKCL